MSVSAATHTFQMSDHLSDDILVGRPIQDEAKTKKELTMFAEEEPSFWDVLDVINPLQHIPIVNNLYREFTGDEIGVGARLAGGALFGGPVGLIASAINCAIEEETGNDTGGHLLALFRDDEAAPADEQGPAPTAIAKAEPAPPPAVSKTEFAFVPQKGVAEDPMPEGPPMMFSADGTVVPAAAPSAVAKPVPLIGQPAPRFMPTPARNPGLTARNSPPPISVPISNSGTRSNVPITGRDPVANATAPNPATIQRILESQGHAGAEHPMASLGKSAGGQSPDWFSGAMMSGLDKYEQAAKLNRKPDQAGGAVQ